MDNKKQTLIEMPDSVREGLPQNREVGRVATRGVVSVPTREVVSRPVSDGRYNNGVVSVEKTEGTLIEFPGFDALTAQPRTYGDATASKERPTEHDPDEV